MTGRVVPIAYVTMWAKSGGIVVWENAEAEHDGYLHRAGERMAFVSAKHWTTDKATAEERWREAVANEAKRLKLAAKKYEALAKGAPVYAKEEG